MHQSVGTFMGYWAMMVLFLPDRLIFTSTTQSMFFAAGETMVDNIGGLILHSVWPIVGDPAYGTSPWAMGCWLDTILAVDIVGKDDDGMFLVYWRIWDVGVR